jgi:hypothetical protein
MNPPPGAATHLRDYLLEFLAALGEPLQVHEAVGDYARAQQLADSSHVLRV